jgi:hypothetical protein
MSLVKNIDKKSDFPRADKNDLDKFDPRSKVCNMNCGPSTDDPRSISERKFLCTDCFVK